MKNMIFFNKILQVKEYLIVNYQSLFIQYLKAEKIKVTVQATYD